MNQGASLNSGMSLTRYVWKLNQELALLKRPMCSSQLVLSQTSLTNTNQRIRIPTNLSKLTAKEFYHKIHGVLCIYKEQGTTVETIKMQLKRNLLLHLESLEQRPLRQLVKICEENVGTNLPVVTTVPDLSDHPLVLGPRYVEEDLADLQEHVPLSEESSGVQLFSLGRYGMGLMEKFTKASPLRIYHVTGKLGIATNNFLDSGTLVERANHIHMTQRRLHRLVHAYQAAYRHKMFHRAGLDLQSQEAYEAASKGVIRPKEGDEGALIVGLELIKFHEPYFTLEVHMLNGDAGDLAELIHRLAIQGKTRAATARIHRLRHGPFALDDALLRLDWDPDTIANSVQHNLELLYQHEDEFSSGLT